MANEKTTEKLLKILYNFKSEDSCIKKELTTKREGLVAEQEENDQLLVKEKDLLQNLTEDQISVEKGLGLAEDFFEFYDNNISLQRYFRLLNVEFDPEELKAVVLDQSQCTTLGERIKNDIDNSALKIARMQQSISDNDIKIEELEEKISDYERARNELGRIITDVLGGIETYTRNYIGDILRKISSFSEKYALTEHEIATISKLILFPEEELKDFNDLVLKNQIDFRNIEFDKVEGAEAVEEQKEEVAVSPLIEEPKDTGIFASPTVEETKPVVLEPKAPLDIEETAPEKIENEENPFVTFEEVVAEKTENQNLQEEQNSQDIQSPQDIYGGISTDIIPIVDIGENTDTSANETDLFEELSLDANNFSEKEKAISILEKSDKEVLKRNIEELKALNANEEVIYFMKNDYVLLADSELPSKINLFRSKNIKEETIKEIILTNYELISLSLSTIKDNIALIEQNGGKIDESNYLLIKNPQGYYAAVKNAEGYEIVLDEKQMKYAEAALTGNAQNSIGVNEVLKEYGISSSRRNGKSEIDIYFKTPKEVEDTLDSIIEVGGEKVLRTTPEMISVDATQTVKKIKYLESQNESYVDDNGYCKKVVYLPTEFQRMFPDVILPEIPTQKENNDSLSNEGSKYNDIISILIESLNNYYSEGNANSYQTIKIDDAEMQEIFNAIKAELEGNSSLENDEKNTYKLYDEYFSKTKFERNLSYLITSLKNSNENIEGIKNELAIVSLLYNSRKDNLTIAKIVSQFLGLDVTDKIGGPTL